MKGIILAGGSGSRLYPLTSIVSKQLQPIYNKPMIYYPLSLLMLSGITDILLISTPHDIPHFQKLFAGSEKLGINLSFKIQEQPNGLAEAFILGEEFIGDDDVTMILGDNLFYGNFQVFRDACAAQTKKENGHNARVFAYHVNDPQRYGVVEFDSSTGKAISIEEKPTNPKSNFAIPGLYIFDNTATKRAKEITPSVRGEIEITELIKSYLEEGSLEVHTLNRGLAWLDSGTPSSLLEASAFIGAIEQRQGIKVACLEEIAYRTKLISPEQFKELIETIPKSEYREYLEIILREETL